MCAGAEEQAHAYTCVNHSAACKRWLEKKCDINNEKEKSLLKRCAKACEESVGIIQGFFFCRLESRVGLISGVLDLFLNRISWMENRNNFMIYSRQGSLNVDSFGLLCPGNPLIVCVYFLKLNIFWMQSET